MTVNNLKTRYCFIKTSLLALRNDYSYNYPPNTFFVIKRYNSHTSRLRREDQEEVNHEE